MDKVHQESSSDNSVLRISYDAKDKVSIGHFSRGGKNWSKVKANDHDFSKEFVTPFGLYLPELKETNLYFVNSKITADCIVDVLEDFWTLNKERFSHIRTLVLNSDNGPECHSRRTWFVKRICEFAQKNKIIIKLAYYPPYHSKYNPIERVWGGLEQHWNGDIMDSLDTIVQFAQTFTWAGQKANVKIWDKTYNTGLKLSSKMMKLYEKAMERLNDEIGKWFVTINPTKVKNTFCTNTV